jgi:hypothetical protein
MFEEAENEESATIQAHQEVKNIVKEEAVKKADRSI